MLFCQRIVECQRKKNYIFNWFIFKTSTVFIESHHISSQLLLSRIFSPLTFEKDFERNEKIQVVFAL